MFFLGSAAFCFAGVKFVVAGRVTAVNGNRVTVTDDAGKVMTIEGDAKGIKVGDRVLLVEGKPEVRGQLTAIERDFLTGQCQIDRADVDVIEQLPEDGKRDVFPRIEKGDCKLLAAFKDSRAYFRSLKPGAKVPLPPAGWDSVYLTDDEFARYADIIANAPW